MEIIGFISGVLVGISLGLIGSGGSIFTIPILVYLIGISPSKTTVYSLFIVGVSALVGSIKASFANLIHYKWVFYFGIPSVISVFVMRKFLMPLVPDILWQIEGFSLKKDLLIMLTFAILMVISSISMIKLRKEKGYQSVEPNISNIIIKGVLVGILTGFVGVGGGFLIIPTLTLKARLPIKNAIATSLTIIAANALIGFTGSLSKVNIDWRFLISFTLMSVLGILLGMFLNQKISNEKLKSTFGWFVLCTGIYIIIKELISF